jgi:hypothetical protein
MEAQQNCSAEPSRLVERPGAVGKACLSRRLFPDDYGPAASWRTPISEETGQFHQAASIIGGDAVFEADRRLLLGGAGRRYRPRPRAHALDALTDKAPWWRGHMLSRTQAEEVCCCCPVAKSQPGGVRP